jgi:DNA-binding SARP family transcriptional activator
MGAVSTQGSPLQILLSVWCSPSGGFAARAVLADGSVRDCDNAFELVRFLGSRAVHNRSMHAPHATGLELQLLGPVRVLHQGQALPLKTRKAFALLALLALEGSASRQRLCALLWPCLDESSARRNLRRELVRLREAGAAAALYAEGDQLRRGAELGCDLLHAERLFAAGQAEAALDLWRGPVAEGLQAEDEAADGQAYARDAGGEEGLSPWLATVQQRAANLRQHALQSSAAAAEARGDVAGALQQVQHLLRIDNLQEAQHREAMRLLLASGRREAALRQFELCQQLLFNELGLQPMPQTLALAQQARQAEPAAPARAGQAGAVLARVSAAPVARPGSAASGPATGEAAEFVAVSLPAQLPFVGREAEVAQLKAAWVQRAPAILAGEGGVGKTRLAADVAAAQGPYALVRCQSGDADFPLASFTRALRVLAGQPPDVQGLEPWVRSELSRLLPELGSAPPPLRNANERLRFDEACLRAWHALSAEAFDVIVLDDWQWADAASQALLARVVAQRQQQRGGALELLTWRGQPDAPALQACAEALGAHLLRLAPLPEPAVQELVRQLSGSAEPLRFSRRLASATGGLPFFIAETLRDLAERGLLRSDAAGRWQTPFDEYTADYAELPVARSVREAVLARVRRLGPSALRLLEAAALATEPLAAARLAKACALSEFEALEALDEAARMHLVVAREGGGYAWAHDLARLALDATLEPTRRRLLHHRLALAAEAQGANAEAARHFELCGEPARAVPHRLAAGDAAQALLAPAEAAQHWQKALADAPAPADEAAAWVRLCEAHWLLGEVAQAQAAHERLQSLLAQGAAGTRPHADARADLLLRSAGYLVQAGRAQEGLAQLQGMAQPKAAALRLRWWSQRMGALQQCGRLDESLADGLKALHAAKPGSAEQADVMARLATTQHSRGHIRDAVAYAEASHSVYSRLGDAQGQARALFYRGVFRLELDEVAAAQADLRACARLAALQGNVFLQRLALYNLACSYSNLSQPAQALEVAGQAWPTLAATPREAIALAFRSMFIECHFQLGQWGPMWEHLVPAVSEVLVRPQMLTVLGVANCAIEPAAVLGQWAQVQPLVQALDGPMFENVPAVAEMLLGCVQAALVRGDLAAAAAWLQRVGPPAEQEQARVRCRAEILQVALALALGDASASPASLPADDAPGMSAELRLRALVLRWRLGVLPRDQAIAAAQAPDAHAGVALGLAQTLGGPVYAAQRQRLAEGLAAWPALRESFLATWR